ncbi:MAG: putative AIPM/Hcit synthase family transferase aq [Clostridiales bacterium]|nr:putative AIPM/Hcit synthase family transferase aq [Clostridiales bacterium]
MKQINIFDSTLRDGAQAEGISFSVEDKLKVVKALDELGVAYIEAGNPGSNPKDLEFFIKVKALELKNAKLTAFGSTRRRDITPEEDANVLSLLSADTKVVAIFGKSWDFHVTDIIKTSLEENLKMIQETVSFLKGKDKEVVFDAEHFFDGYKSNKEYAMNTLEAAVSGKADSLALCDTNGGCTPDEIYEITKEVVDKFKEVEVGIHCHNDSGMAVANSIMAVKAGATQVQGTYVGFGERCGNANLSSLIPTLQIKKGFHCIPEENIETLTSTAILISEIANVTLSDKEPYVGRSAFTHKAGMHIDGVNKAPHSFEHINPELVGNERRFLMSEVAGRSTIIKKISRIDPSITKDSEETTRIVEKLKKLEYYGYQFEGADSSFELLIRKQLGKYEPFFDLEYFKIIGEQKTTENQFSSYAMVKVKVDEQVEFSAAEGDGPVNALDKALRKSLEGFYPKLKTVHLTDYKVRVLDSLGATAAKVRVLITSTDGTAVWTTVGVSTDIIEASLIALVDSIEYKLIKDIENRYRTHK